MIFKKVRKPSAANVWAQNTPNYDTLAKEALHKLPQWHQGMSRQEEFPLQITVRNSLYESLPQEEKDIWERKAQETKNAEPDKCVIIIYFSQISRSSIEYIIGRTCVSHCPKYLE